MHEIREVLRLWLRGESERAIARLSLVDRKTVKRYVTAGVEAGLVRDGDEGQLSDGLIGRVCERSGLTAVTGMAPAGRFCGSITIS